MKEEGVCFYRVWARGLLYTGFDLYGRPILKHGESSPCLI